MTTSLEPRIVELERRAALYERTSEELSAVVAEQARAIDALALRVRRLLERLQAAEAAIGEQRTPQDDKPPPHY